MVCVGVSLIGTLNLFFFRVKLARDQILKFKLLKGCKKPGMTFETAINFRGYLEEGLPQR